MVKFNSLEVYFGSLLKERLKKEKPGSRSVEMRAQLEWGACGQGKGEKRKKI